MCVCARDCWLLIGWSQGIAVRIEADPNRLLMGTSYKDLGVKHYCVGNDLDALWGFFNADGAAHNKTLGREPPSALPYGAHRGGNLPNAAAMGYGATKPTAAAKI